MVNIFEENLYSFLTTRFSLEEPSGCADNFYRFHHEPRIGILHSLIYLFHKGRTTSPGSPSRRDVRRSLQYSVILLLSSQKTADERPDTLGEKMETVDADVSDRLKAIGNVKNIPTVSKFLSTLAKAKECQKTNGSAIIRSQRRVTVR